MSKFIVLFLFCIAAVMMLSSVVVAQDAAAVVPKACDICKSSCSLVKIDAAKEKCLDFCENKVCSLSGKVSFADEVEEMAAAESRFGGFGAVFDDEDVMSESEKRFSHGLRKPKLGGAKEQKKHEGHKHVGALGLKCRICNKSCDKSKTEEGKAKCKNFCASKVCQKEQEQEVPKPEVKPAVEPAADFEALAEGFESLPCKACDAGACDLIKNPIAKAACKFACSKCHKDASSEVAEPKFGASFADEEAEEMSDADLKLIKLPCTLCKRGACSLLKTAVAQSKCETTCKKLKFCNKKPSDKKKKKSTEDKKKKPVAPAPAVETEADAEIDWSAVKTKVSGFVNKNKCNLCNVGCKLIRKDEWKQKCVSFCDGVCKKEQPAEETAPAADEPIFG